MRERPVGKTLVFGVVAGLLGLSAAGAALLLALAGPAGSSPLPVVPRFVDESGSAGLDQQYAGDFDYVVGGGVAVFDCNDDLLADAYVAGGSADAGLFVNRSDVGGRLRFERLSSPPTDLPAVTGAYPLDIDGDGLLDLAVLRRGENVLLRGLGNCRFERGNEAWQFDGGDAWSTAFSATWESDASWPTLAVGNYLDQSTTTTYRCFDNQLFRPDGAGRTFASPTPLAPGWCALSMLFSSWDRSGRADLRVSNDRHYYLETSAGQEQLWRVAPGETPREYVAADGWQPLRIWGMGIASYDVTGDGLPEYYLTSQGDNKLQTLADGRGRPRYVDIALRTGVTAHRPFTGGEVLPSTAWHADFQDVNNDGLVDLFVAKGNVGAELDHAMRDPSNLLLGQPDGSFSDAAEDAGVLNFGRARGAALVDLNRDGLLDLLLVNRNEPVRVWRNVGAGTADAGQQVGHWLGLRLRQDGANRDAVGAWVAVRAGGRTMEREVTVGGGHAGGQLGPLHFGLAAAARAEVRVTWPDAEVGEWMSVPADGYFLVDRGATRAVPLESVR
ncbi:MAG: CRTAC1 family protein [Chloroflexota bacterium]|nr:CRTAC1 family protein [Chloroflexota bacterium]